MKKITRDIFWVLIGIPFLFLAVLLAPIYLLSRIFQNNKKPRLMFGPNPIISNKYWSKAMNDIGYDSETLMKYHFAIQKKEDFNKYYQNISFLKHGAFLGNTLNPFIVFFYILVNYDIVHIPMTGCCEFGRTPLWRAEYFLLRLYRIKTIGLPYGGDFYSYSNVIDKSFAFTLNISYPLQAKQESSIKKKVDYWVNHADFFLPVFQLDGIGRFDAMMFSYSMIDTKLWAPKRVYSKADGTKKPVVIVHTPNHRGVKGTEFIIEAVNRLKNDGLQIELLLMEGMQNLEVQNVMQNKADILVEQIISTSYAMSGVEGMASGLPVVSNLENKSYTQVFERYSYLKECPILSSCPETIYEKLKELIINPELRKELGLKSRLYVEKYHSFKTAQYFFPKIYDKIWFKKNIDFTGMFHPLNPDSYNNQNH